MDLQFVILHHTGIAEPHFDFMFEMDAGEPLMTLRSLAWPPALGDVLIELEPHRSAYLEYEGPVSGDRGHVRRVERGDLEHFALLEDPITVGLRLHTTDRTIELSIASEPGEDGVEQSRWRVVTLVSQPRA